MPQAEEFLRLTLPGEGSKIFTNSFLADRPEGAGLEGYLYPDSYLIENTESAEDIIKRFLDNFEKHLPPSQERSLYDIVTMASILEKEVQTLEDKKKVAGILWKRMEYNLPLQVDSTGSYFFLVPLETVSYNTSYNTYSHTGLPFGPISNPSSESLIAAVQFLPSDYWYYLSSRDGTIVYSKTLGEHLINKAKFID